MTDFKTSIKRIYTRFIVLTTVVVFGAIAIAQAKKEPESDAIDQVAVQNANALDTYVHTPIPVTASSSESAEVEQSLIRQVSVEMPVSESAEEDAYPVHENDRFSVDYEPIDDISDDAPAGFPEEIEKSSVQAYQTNDGWSDTNVEVIEDAKATALPDISGQDSESSYGLDDLPPIEKSSAEGTDLPVVESVGYDDLPNVETSELQAAAAYESAALTTNVQDPYELESGLKNTLAQEPLPQTDPPTQNSPTPPRAESELDPAATVAPVATAAAAVYDPQTQANHFEPNSVATRTAADFQNDPATTVGEYEPQPNGEQAVANPEPVNVATRGRIIGTAKPGPQSLEGLQTPTLTLQKTAPAEVQVGQPARFEIRVRNVGRVSADHVVIRDPIPAGTKVLESNPPAEHTDDGSLYWETGSLPPGQEVIVSVDLMPLTEGLVGSVATVGFQASASARTRSTKPDLRLEHSGPLKVLEGEPVKFSIELSNPGSGAATHVVLEEVIPTGLSHSSGGKLEYEVGMIEPGQTRHLELTLKAAQAGHVVNTLVARADGNLLVEDVVEMDVVAPKLQVAVQGPKTRYLERQAEFTVSVANPGTASAKNVELVANLPRGLKFVSTNNSGYFDQTRNAVIWSLEQLPAGEMGRAQFTAMPVEMGSFQVRAEGKADRDLTARQEHTIAVEGIAALFFGLADKTDPIEAGAQTSYEINVVNQGSKAATNVKFIATLPEGMQLVNVQGPTGESVQGHQVHFDPIDNLPPKGTATYQIIVKGTTAGDHRFRVEMISDETQTPVLKEESTRVYAD